MPHHAKNGIHAPIGHYFDHLVHQGRFVLSFWHTDVEAILALFNSVGEYRIIIAAWWLTRARIAFVGVPGADNIAVLQKAVAQRANPPNKLLASGPPRRMRC